MLMNKRMRAAKTKGKWKGGNDSDEPICPITLEPVPEGEGFHATHSRTLYSARALFEWWKNQRQQRAALTYPHNRQHPSHHDVERLVQQYRQITNDPSASLDVHVLPVPLLEPHTAPTDIRRRYQDFLSHGPISSWNDVRMTEGTFRDINLQQIVLQAYMNAGYFFRASQAEKMALINRAVFIDRYSQIHKRAMLHFQIDYPLVFERTVAIPYEDERTGLHSLQLSFSFKYKHGENTRWMVFHYSDNLYISFNIENESDAEEILYTTGADGLLDGDDDPIVFLEMNEISFQA